MEKLLVVLICLISGLSICFVHSEIIDAWGEMSNVRGIDQQKAIARWWLFFIQTRTLKFPAKGEYDLPISAIQHINFTGMNVTTELLDGGIGSKYVELRITSQRNHGIDSMVVLFTKLDE